MNSLDETMRTAIIRLRANAYALRRQLASSEVHAHRASRGARLHRDHLRAARPSGLLRTMWSLELKNNSITHDHNSRLVNDELQRRGLAAAAAAWTASTVVDHSVETGHLAATGQHVDAESFGQIDQIISPETLGHVTVDAVAAAGMLPMVTELAVDLQDELAVLMQHADTVEAEQDTAMNLMTEPALGDDSVVSDEPVAAIHAADQFALDFGNDAYPDGLAAALASDSSFATEEQVAEPVTTETVSVDGEEFEQ